MPHPSPHRRIRLIWHVLLLFGLVPFSTRSGRANSYFLYQNQVWSQPTWNGPVDQEPPFGPPGPADDATIDNFTVTAAAGTTVGQLESEEGTLVMQGTFNCDSYLPNGGAQATGPGTMLVQTIDADSLDFPAAGVNLVGGGSYSVTNLTGAVDFDGASLSIQNYAGSSAGIGVVISSGIATIQSGGVTNGPVVVSSGAHKGRESDPHGQAVRGIAQLPVPANAALHRRQERGRSR
jgi:hypothetical protein